MERKTKHRILGICVVVGLVVISLPLFQGNGKEVVTALVNNAPSFPDQVTQANNRTVDVSAMKVQASPIPIQDSSDNGINQLPDDTIAPNHAAPANPPQAPSIPQPGSPSNSDSSSHADNATKPAPDVSDEPDDSVDDEGGIKNPSMTSKNPEASNLTSSPVGDKVEAPGNKTSPNKDNLFKNDEIKQPSLSSPSSIKQTSTGEKSLLATKMQSAALKATPLDVNGLIKLKKSVWVVQLGSFKNKENAIRLVNRLRSKGYHAFIQQVASRTRVFVGPESKQQIAMMMASQLEEEMHITGIVVSYKPLTL